MPTYTFKCEACDHQFDRILRLAEFDDPQACPECAVIPAKRIIGGPVGFVLRGDGWTGKNLKIKSQMAKRRAGLAAKEREIKNDGPGVRLAPNVGGERVDSWSEAQRLAKSKGKDTSSYDKMIRKERAGG
jgi:putative FmdB family regulatory protein